MEYLYSIIIPHYNDFERLKILLGTIPKRNDIQILIIDDNSTEPLCLDDCENPNIFIFINKSGVQSAGACRNVGLSNAKGKWLLFADSDDFFTVNAFDILDKNSDDNFEIIYFSPSSVNSKTGLSSNRHIGYRQLVLNYIRKNQSNINYFFHVPWSKLILNCFVKNNAIFFDEIVASNDVIFSLKVGMSAKHINAVDEEIYCVTKREGSLTSLINFDNMRIRYGVALRRNKILFEFDLKAHQESFYSLFKTYNKILNLHDLLGLCKLLLKGELLFVPLIFKTYLFNPSILYDKLFSK